MHPLKEAVHKAVGQFTDNHQSLSMLMVNTLVAIIEMEVGPLLAAALARHPSLPGVVTLSGEEAEDVRSALSRLLYVIKAAGIDNLVKGVQLGQMSWYMKCTDAVAHGESALSLLPHTEPTTKGKT